MSQIGSVAVGSDGLKNSVLQQEIKPWSLVFQASIITARPPRKLSAVTLVKNNKQYSSTNKGEVVTTKNCTKSYKTL